MTNNDALINIVAAKTILSGLGAPLQVTRGQFKEVE